MNETLDLQSDIPFGIVNINSELIITLAVMEITFSVKKNENMINSYAIDHVHEDSKELYLKVVNLIFETKKPQI